MNISCCLSRKAQTSLSPAATSSSSGGIARRSQTNERQSLQCFLGLPRGLLPEGHALNTSPGRRPGGIRTRCPSHLIWLLSMRRSSGSTPNSSWMAELLTHLISKEEPSHPTEEAHFGHLYPPLFTTTRPLQDSPRDTVECLLQVHKTHVDWLGKFPCTLKDPAEGVELVHSSMPMTETTLLFLNPRFDYPADPPLQYP
ncbi:hypothetical protein D4764_01G0016570 [Takifugu flavidus]|uniref:Uncharacterized protein n=1 Tax=Takifugu flavidus TaxID=433684 RepID=A0A5C6PPR6_9TELE|nr:hypothetical protein D4764_01G0016570 [Takifugu flavidus]